MRCIVLRRQRQRGDDWRTEILIEREISDIAVADIDGDGEDEILAFEGFMEISHNQ